MGTKYLKLNNIKAPVEYIFVAYGKLVKLYATTYLHIYFCAVNLLSNCFDDSNYNVLESFSLGIVMQNESLPLFCISTSKGRGPHTWVYCSKVVMKSIKVLQGDYLITEND